MNMLDWLRGLLRPHGAMEDAEVRGRELDASWGKTQADAKAAIKESRRGRLDMELELKKRR